MLLFRLCIAYDSADIHTNSAMVESGQLTSATLRKDLSIATGTMTKLRKNEDVALSVLLRICQYLHCNIGNICDAVESDI